jgi:thiamine-phosphate pyrophosphorylase
MDAAVLRIFDANVNRAREALRVMEDYARFALNHDELSRSLKDLRHDLAAATSSHAATAILYRDTPGDVGTDNKTDSEQQRTSLASVVTAAGKRLSEALRVIEETLKIDDPHCASRIENLRYRCYDLEQTIARTLNRAQRFRDVRLYVLLTESLCRRPWLETAAEALLGGADCIQLREKEMNGGELLKRARSLVALCHQHHALCIINDRPDIAIFSGADGVHVGQTDLPAQEVRKLIGQDRILGVSTQKIEQARQAVLDGADYIGVGPVFASTTKKRDTIAGLDYAREVTREISLPAVAIAGIDLSNVDEVLATGMRAIAMTAAVVSSNDPRAAAAALKARLVAH